MQEFKHEYDLEKLQRIIPTNHDFQMLVTPRYFDHYQRNPYEQFTADLMLNRCKDDMLFIDIGSHYGFYTLLVGTRYRNAKIHAFEPVTENYKILRRNLELNNLSNVEAYNLAVSNKDESRILHVTEASDSCGFYEHPNTSTVRFVEVKAVALDSFLNDIPNVATVIKVDTEGHEICVLEGMKGILREAQDISLFVGFNPACLRSAGCRPEGLLEEIDRLGFEVYFIDDERRQTYKISTVNFKNWTDYLGHQGYSNLFCRKKSQSLSVCFFSHSSRLAGAERILLELTGQLIRDYGVICTVVLPNDGPLKTRLEKVGASTLIGDYGWWCDLSSCSDETIRATVTGSFKKLMAEKLQKINKINPDIVFTVTMTIPWGAIVASTLGRPHVWFITEFGVLDSNLKFVQPFTRILEIIKQASNLTLTLSDAVRIQLFGNIGDDEVLTVYPSVNIPDDTFWEEGTNYFCHANALKLVITGHIAEHKGQKDAILAVRELIMKGKKMELLIVGSSVSWYLEELERIVLDENLREYVKFFEFKDNPYPVVKQADIVLVCSRSEALGRVTVEGMLLKKPIIGTNSGGTVELINEGENGLLYEPGDYKTLGQKIEYLEEHREKIREFGENGYQFALENFTGGKDGRKVYGLLKDLKVSNNPSSFSYPWFLGGIGSDAVSQQQLEMVRLERVRAENEKKVSEVISGLEVHVERQQRALKDRERELKDQQQKLKDQEQALRDHELTLKHQQQALKEIRNSLGWMVLAQYTRLRDKVLPRGTRRRNAYEFLMVRAKVLWMWPMSHQSQDLAEKAEIGKIEEATGEGLEEKAGVEEDEETSGEGLEEKAKAEEIEEASGEGEKVEVKYDYEHWVKTYDTLSDLDRATIRAYMDGLASRPLISIVMPVYNTPERWLRLAIESVRNQIYPNWELCIADDASTEPHVRCVLEDYLTKDSRIKVVFREKNGHISAASNEALEMVTGDFVGLLDHDDELAEQALFLVAVELNTHPEADLIYSDEDKIDEDDLRYDPYFKPDWNPGLFMGQNYVSHLSVYRTRVVREVVGFRLGYEGSQDWDLAMRVTEKIPSCHIRHIPNILYHWRAIPGSFALRADEKGYAKEAQFKTLKTHFTRLGENVTITPAAGVYWRIKFALPHPPPHVTLIIPTRNCFDLLHRCVESIYEKTAYPNFDLMVVDNQSDEPRTLEYLRRLERERAVRILRYDAPFNYSAINNFAVQQARGEIIGLINNDLEVISPEWLEEMVSHAVRAEIGAVGAMLYYPNDTIQQAGVILGWGGVATHAYNERPRGYSGQASRPLLCQDLSAVTAACLIIRKEVYEEVGGMDDTHLPITFNDVDLCLRIREKGYRNFWTPYAEHYHYESASRGSEDTPEKETRFIREVEYMKRRWGELLLRDPAYNPNLTLDGESFMLAFPPRVRKPWLQETS